VHTKFFRTGLSLQDAVRQYTKVTGGKILWQYKLYPYLGLVAEQHAASEMIIAGVTFSPIDPMPLFQNHYNYVDLLNMSSANASPMFNEFVANKYPAIKSYKLN
jgi:hypothetical protein